MKKYLCGMAALMAILALAPWAKAQNFGDYMTSYSGNPQNGGLQYDLSVTTPKNLKQVKFDLVATNSTSYTLTMTALALVNESATKPIGVTLTDSGGGLSRTLSLADTTNPFMGYTTDKAGVSLFLADATSSANPSSTTRTTFTDTNGIQWEQQKMVVTGTFSQPTTYDLHTVASVPEPSSAVALIGGVSALWLRRPRRRR